MSANIKEQVVDFDPATGRVLHPPRHVFVELTSRCNLACVHCPKDFGAELDHPALDMTLEVLNAAAPYLRQARFVNLNMVGESMLYRHFDEAIGLCAEGHAEVSFNTNGLLLSEARSRHIVASRVHSVTVSVDGIESNEPIRGVDYATLRKRILQLAAAKERAGSALPHLAVAFTLMRRNAGELARIVADLAGAVKLHAIYVQPLVVYYESLRGENPYRQSDVEAHVARAKEVAAAVGTNLVFFRSALEDDERNRKVGLGQIGQASGRYGCIDPFYEIKIRSTGEIMGCSYGLMPGLRVQEHDLEGIWNHEWYRTLRRHLHRQEFIGRCAKCPYVHGGILSQEDPVRVGVKHSQEARFFAGGYQSGGVA
jgi:MoaA/NifB/PqqE/SkfB family radical SAM enzyme